MVRAALRPFFATVVQHFVALEQAKTEAAVWKNKVIFLICPLNAAAVFITVSSPRRQHCLSACP
jgi:molybdopterin synthase catalytic subunit